MEIIVDAFRQSWSQLIHEEVRVTTFSLGSQKDKHARELWYKNTHLTIHGCISGGPLRCQRAKWLLILGRKFEKNKRGQRKTPPLHLQSLFVCYIMYAVTPLVSARLEYLFFFFLKMANG